MQILTSKPNFQQVLKACLLHELTHRPVLQLLRHCEVLDISMNQIYFDYVQKYGRIPWLEEKGPNFLTIKHHISLALRHTDSRSLSTIIAYCQELVTIGPAFSLLNISPISKRLTRLVTAVQRDFSETIRHIQVKEFNSSRYDVVITSIDSKHQIADLVLNHLDKHYTGYLSIVSTPSDTFARFGQFVHTFKTAYNPLPTTSSTAFFYALQNIPCLSSHTRETHSSWQLFNPLRRLEPLAA